MGRSARKRHEQLELEKLQRRRDKNGQWRGGSRPGAGRPSFKKLGLGSRASERHQKRLSLRASWPAHVILRAHPAIGSMRKGDMFHAIREALITVWRLEDSFHVVQFSVQRTHIHLLVEANDRLALAKGMQAFGISAAKHINALIRDEDGKRRRGSVFPDRYHVKILKTPRQVRNCLTYVLNNWRHHGEDQGERSRAWHLDPFSSAVTFEGWKERESRDGQRYVQPPSYIAPLVCSPRRWLLNVGWRRYGLISAFEVPGRAE
jgi:REP element-mobilizing transposase RayT